MTATETLAMVLRQSVFGNICDKEQAYLVITPWAELDQMDKNVWIKSAMEIVKQLDENGVLVVRAPK